MKVQVRYFASLREALGTGEGLEPPEGSTVAGARDALIARGGASNADSAGAAAQRSALNQALCESRPTLSRWRGAGLLPAGHRRLR